MEIAVEASELADLVQMDRLVAVQGLGGNRVRLRTRGTVGTLVTGDTRLTVRARHLSRDAVLGLVDSDAGGAIHDLPALAGEDDDLFRLVAIALCDETRQLFQRGLRRAYAGRSIQADTLRGEPDLDRWHGTRSPENAARPWSLVRERHLDLPEHRMLRAALRLLSRNRAADEPLRRRAAGLEDRLASVPAVPPSPSTWARLRTDGLFASYGRPVNLARILLSGTFAEDGDDRGCGFILDLDRLFERWLSRELVRLAPTGWTVAAQHPVKIAGNALDRFLDVAIWDPSGRLRMVLDAKNKDLGADHPPREDVHQMVTYMATRSCRHGVLVGMGSSPSSKRFEMTGGVGTLEVVRLPGTRGIEQLRGHLRAWVERCLLGSGQPNARPDWLGPSA
jgi:5-methylcytosine-specific restriction enzyme subunit McrC